jgi:hypothetical protein
MSKEVTVILKDAERTCRQKFLIYEDFCLKHDDPVINMCIESARKNFDGDPDDIQVRVLLVVR